MKKKSERPFAEAMVAIAVRGSDGSVGWRQGKRLPHRDGKLCRTSAPGMRWGAEVEVGKPIKLEDGERGVTYTVTSTFSLFPSMPECAAALLVDTIEATGGITRDDFGCVVPVGDEYWVDLASAYLAACVTMNKRALIAGKYKPVRSLNVLDVVAK